jgi:hypothetical protein
MCPFALILISLYSLLQAMGLLDTLVASHLPEALGQSVVV